MAQRLSSSGRRYGRRMSYDLTFADPHRDSEVARTDTAPPADVWRRIVARVRSRLDGVEVTLTDAYGE